MTRSARLALRRAAVPRCSGALLACALAAACGGGTEPTPPDNTITLSARQVWAGSDLTIRSARIGRASETPTVLLGTFVVPATRVDSTTLGVTVPADVLGDEYTVSLRFPNTTFTGPKLHVAGLTDMRPVGAFRWLAYVTPVLSSGEPEVIGGTLDTVVVLNAATGQARTYAPFTMTPGGNFPHGPGTSWLPDRWWLQSPTFECGLYRLQQTAELVQPFPCGISYYDSALSPERWLSLQREFAMSAGGGIAPFTTVSWPGPAVFSPTGDRVTFPARYSRTNSGPPGHPVYSAPDGDLAYVVPVDEPVAVAFSPDGALLAVAVGSGIQQNDTTTPRVEIYRAATGQAVGSALLPDWPQAVAFDPVAPVLYVAIGTHGPTVDVFAVPGLEPLGRMHAPTPPGVGETDLLLPMVFTFSSEPALYLVAIDWSSIWPRPTFSARFSILRP